MDTTSSPIVPVQSGDWVICDFDDQIAKVKRLYFDDGELFGDLVFYDFDGDRTGRSSPALGGPRSFEPAMTMQHWRRIEAPDFPVQRPLKWVLDPETGKRTAKHVTGVKRLPDRNEPLRARKSPKRKAAPSRVLSDYNPELEASSRRMAAQTLRDAARTMDADTATTLKEKARVLEQEADRIFPRF